MTADIDSGHASDAEIRQSDSVIREQDEVFGFDVAVEHFLAVSERDRLQHLLGQIQTFGQRHSARQSVMQRLLAQREADDKVTLVEAGEPWRENTGMLQADSNPDLLQQGVKHALINIRRVWDFESHSQSFNGIRRCVDTTEATVSQPTIDAVFPQHLAGSQ